MTKVDVYLDALRGVESFQRAIKDGGETPERKAALHQAKIDAKLAYGRLTGSELGQVRRRLHEGPK